MDRDSEVKIEKRDNNGRQREKLSDGETERERYSSKDNSLQDKAGYKKGRSKALKKKKRCLSPHPCPSQPHRGRPAGTSWRRCTAHTDLLGTPTAAAGPPSALPTFPPAAGQAH